MEKEKLIKQYKSIKQTPKQLKQLHISKISVLHYIKLVFRILLMLGIFLEYLYRRLYTTESFYDAIHKNTFFLSLVWIVFVIEMVLRFFPSSLESPGCQKQFSNKFIRAEDIAAPSHFSKKEHFRTVIVAILWITLNCFIAALYIWGIIDEGILVIISLFYSVADMICILFFCPFQSWIMQNRCCTVCRIYNWDFLMMFTPMIFIRSFYSQSLVLLSVILFIRWELTAFLHPERFDEKTNLALSCAHCPEKLCRHKKQLHRLWKHQLDTEKARIKKETDKLRQLANKL